MIPLGASSCARKTILRSTEQWRIFVKTMFNLCVHLCHGKYLNVHKKLLFYNLHVALCYTTWEPAIVVNQCVPNSYWIMQENGTEQPKVYRHTRTMLKIRSTPTAVEQTGHMKDYPTEIRKSESKAPAIPNMVRDSVHENSLENISPDPVQLTLPRLDLS